MVEANGKGKGNGKGNGKAKSMGSRIITPMHAAAQSVVADIRICP